MMITMTATNKLTTIDGRLCRVWEGRTGAGIACTVFVHRIAVLEEADRSEFDHELAEQLRLALP